MLRIAPISRRRLLTNAAATSALSLADGIARPSLSRAADRPRLTHGLQSGDVAINSGVVWARADRPARLSFDIATSDSFRSVIRSVSLDALPESDFAVKALIDGLPPGQDIFYRVRSTDLSDTAVSGEPMTGRFRTAPGRPALDLVRVVGRHRRAGLGHRRVARRHEDLRDHAPACGPISSSIRATRSTPTGRSTPRRSCRTAASGRTWCIEEKLKVAETLAEFRAQLQIQSARQEPARLQCRSADAGAVGRPRGDQQLVAVEVADATDKRYSEKSVPLLTARAARAFHEFMPIARDAAGGRRGSIARSPTGRCSTSSSSTCAAIAARTPTTRQSESGPETVFLGRDATGLAQARADGLARDLEGDRRRHAARAHRLRQCRREEGLGGGGARRRAARSGASSRFAELLALHQARRHPQHRVADRGRALHGRALLRSRTRRSSRTSSRSGNSCPGRLHAGTFGPGELDNTFGPQLRYVKAPAKDAAAEPAAELRPAVLRARGDRRRERSDDRDAEGLERPGAVVDQARAESRVSQ